MAYRFVISLLFTFFVFPFAAMYTFAYTYPEAHFAFDQETWLRGLYPILVGWVIFLLPGMLPFVGRRYYSWVARKTGLQYTVQKLFSMIRRITALFRDLVGRVRLPRRTPAADGQAKPMLANLAQAPAVAALRSRLNEIASKSVDSANQEGDTPKRILASKAVLEKGSKQIGVAKHAFEEFRKVAATHLTPDQYQHRIDLNSYTLNIMSHLSTIANHSIAKLSLDPVDMAFCESALSAIPKPSILNLPDDTLDLAPQAFVYPPERRRELILAASRNNITISDDNFEAAANGDIGNALLLLRCIVDEYFAPEIRANTPEEDVILGLPVPSTA